MVSARWPDGLTTPNRTSAIAPPPAWPRSHPSTIASTLSCHPSSVTTPPLERTTTVGVPLAATARISSTCSSGSCRFVRSKPSDSSRSLRPAKTMATSAARAIATASARRDAFFVDCEVGVERESRCGQHGRALICGEGADLVERDVGAGGVDVGAAAALESGLGGERADHRDRSLPSEAEGRRCSSAEQPSLRRPLERPGGVASTSSSPVAVCGSSVRASTRRTDSSTVDSSS